MERYLISFRFFPCEFTALPGARSENEQPMRPFIRILIRTQDLAIRQHSAGASWDTFLSREGSLVVAIAALSRARQETSALLGSLLAVYSSVTAWPVVPSRLKSNRTCITRRDGVSIGGNVHFLAASIARRRKYRLDPVRSRVADDTEPSWSTMTRTDTLICPRMVRWALCEISGITSWSADDDAAASLRPGVVGISAETGARASPATGAALGVCNSDPFSGGDGVECDLSKLIPNQATARITTAASTAAGKARGFEDCVVGDAGRGASGAVSVGGIGFRG